MALLFLLMKMENPLKLYSSKIESLSSKLKKSAIWIKVRNSPIWINRDKIPRKPWTKKV